jgi:hypothetical protein
MLESFVSWTLSTGVGDFVQSHTFLFPIGEALHFMGLSLLIGTIGMVDLRMMGFAKVLPFAPLHRLIPWGIAGFVINLLTGIMFWFVNPELYALQVGIISFYKLLFIFLAGVNLLVFRLTVFHEVMSLGPGDDPPLSAKFIGATSLSLWFGVIWWGRMIMFT